MIQKGNYAVVIKWYKRFDFSIYPNENILESFFMHKSKK